MDDSPLKEIFPYQTQRLRALLEHSGEGSVSLLFSTESTGRDTQGNHTKFKNSLRDATEQLDNSVGSPDATKKLIETLEPISANHDFWQHQFQGLAVYLHKDQCWFVRTPFALTDLTIVSNTFYLKPLFPIMQRLTQCWVLAVAPESVRLFLGTPYFLEEQALPLDIPENIDALGLHIEDEQPLAWGGAGGRSGTTGGGRMSRTVHGHEDQAAEREIPLKYVRAIDAGLQKVLHEPEKPQLPLFLVADQTLADFYHKANTYEYVRKTIYSYPGNSNTVALLELLAPEIRSLEEENQETAREIWNTATAQNQGGVNDPSEAVLDAYKGKFSVLWINEDIAQWGKFDPLTAQVSIFPQRSAGDTELANLAGIYTLRNRGDVYCVPPNKMPQPDLPMASVWRYH